MLRDGTGEIEASWYGVDAERGLDGQCANVHRTLKRIVKARAVLDMQEAEVLREADRLRVWRAFGYGSMVEYMEMELGHSPRPAAERLRVAHAIVELPAIGAALSQGELSYSAARELTRVATDETEQAWLEAANDKNLRDIEQLVSGHKRGDRPDDPVDPKLRKRTLRYEELDEETVAILRQARQILEREVGERLDENQFLRTLGRMVVDAASGGAEGSTRTRAAYQIAVTTCEQCKRAWQDGGGITVEMSPAKRAAAECDAQHIGRVDSNDAASTTKHEPGAASTPAKRTAIPAALRRKVSARDHGRCRVPWCRSSRNVDQHHIRLISEGGEHTLENLISLCESHHIALHEGALILEGDATSARFTRRAQSSFETARQAVATARHATDTAEALRTLGFRSSEVKTAVEKTRTHVGSAQLALEEWIRIALSYCPRPAG